MWDCAVLVVVTSIALGLTHGRRCADIVEWRHKNVTCPAKAICAEVSSPTSWMDNGALCIGDKIAHFCRCSSGPCPIYNDDHMIFYKTFIQQYTCEPKCRHPWCQGTRPLCMYVELFSPEMQHNTFERIVCRCPRHHIPSVGLHTTGGKATYPLSNIGRNPRYGNERYAWRCRNLASDEYLDGPISDPCNDTSC
ncbi:hypothetical protein Btru_035306 [Bulinus truncatus]|nr:hypothetical protein Btru_035306 [Bulinus truncatus]